MSAQLELDAALCRLFETQVPSFHTWDGMGLLVSLLRERGFIWTAGSGEHMGAVACAVVHKQGDRLWVDKHNWSRADEPPAALALAAYRALTGQPWKGGGSDAV